VSSSVQASLGPANPDRARLPTPLTNELTRQRLIDRLAMRWTKKLVTVSAPAGYGKSTVIAQAIRDNDDDPSGTDLYVALRPPAEDPTHLANAILSATRNPEQRPERDVGAAAVEITDQLARFAPHDVALILDDIHHADSPDSAELLRLVLADLPSNAHVVLAGRRIPQIPMARLTASEDLEAVTNSDLAFDPAEMATMADLHGVEASTVDGLASWPALVRLALSAGPHVSREFLLEEIVAHLDANQRCGMATTVVAGRADDDLLARAASPGLTTNDLLPLPLVAELGDGSVIAHDLWAEAINDLVDVDELTKIADHAARWHSGAGRVEEAIDTAARFGRWDSARAALMDALSANDSVLDAPTARRWLQLFARSDLDQPELRLLRAMAARLEVGAGTGIDNIEAAIEEFDRRGELRYMSIAVVELGMQGWQNADRELARRAGHHVRRLAETGDPEMQALLHFSRGMSAAGPREALDHSMKVDVAVHQRAMAPLHHRARATLCFELGDGDQAIDHLRRLVKSAPGATSERTLAAAQFLNGDPSPYLDLTAEVVGHRRESARDTFLESFFACVILSRLGRSDGIGHSLRSANERVRERTYRALATATEFVNEGDENAAALELSRLLAHKDIGPLASRHEFTHFPTVSYVLNREIRSHLDTLDLGPLFVAKRSVARTLLAARTGRIVRGGDLPAHGLVLAALPLRWSVELTGRIANHDSVGAVKLMTYLIDHAGSTVHLLARELANGPGPEVDGLRILLKSVASPPNEILRIRICGSLAVGFGSDSFVAIAGSRVRQLLQLLALRRRVRRSIAAAALWPDHDEQSAANNLRKTLAQLRNALEPDRNPGEQSFHLRIDAEHIELHESDRITVDTWEIDRLIDDGSRLESANLPRSAADAYAAAAQLAVDMAFVDLADVELFAGELRAWSARVSRAVERTARWHLSQNQLDAAARAARRLHALEHGNERAHQVLISVALLENELAAAAKAIELCRSELDDLGIGIGPDTAALVKRYESRIERRTTQ